MPDQAQPNTSPREPDSSRVFALLLKLGMDPGDAYAFVQEVQSMAAENLIARFESKLDAQVVGFEAKLDALAATQKAELHSLRWFITTVIVGVAALVTLLQLIFAANAAS